MTIELQCAVEEFWAARGRGEHFPASYFDRLSLDEAYRIQLALIERRCAEGERQIGWKVGLTSKAIQQQFGQSRDWPFGAAIAFVALGLVMIGLWVYSRKAEKEEVIL